MVSLVKLFILVTALVFVIGHVGCFTETNKLLTALNGVKTKAASSLVCYNSMTTPMGRVEQFVADTVGIYDGLSSFNGRIGTINTLASVIALIPIATPYLGPLTTAISHLSRAISVILTAADPFVNSIKLWKDPINSVKQTKANSVPLLQRVKDAAANGKKHISDRATEFTRLACGGTRSNLVTGFENAARGKDTLPNTVAGELSKADTACGEVRGFFDTTSSKISSQVSTSLSMARSGIDTANSAFNPIQKYIDEVDKVLDKDICLEDAERLLKEAGKAIEGLFPSLPPKPPKPSYTKPSYRKWRRGTFCFSVRKILDGSLAVDAGFKYAAEFAFKEIFNAVMPQLPGLNNDLNNLAQTLTPFSSNFDLKGKAPLLVLSQTNINNFLNVNYVSTFTGQASGSLAANPTTCSGETALSVPSK